MSFPDLQVILHQTTCHDVKVQSPYGLHAIELKASTAMLQNL